jgi:acetyl-CoA C-acetyltransferase
MLRESHSLLLYVHDIDVSSSFLLPRTNPLFGNFETKDSVETDGLWDAHNNFAMGNCAEACAEKYDVSRESLDEHAIESYKRADRSWKAGVFNAEIAPVTIKGKKGDVVIKEDEEYKKVIFEKVPSLKSAFKQGGRITAANSSNLNDGASALILMSAEKARELGLKPLAKVICEYNSYLGGHRLIRRFRSICRCRCRAHRLPHGSCRRSPSSTEESKPDR